MPVPQFLLLHSTQLRPEDGQVQLASRAVAGSLGLSHRPRRRTTVV